MSPVVIIGAGGHAKVVADALLAMGCVVRGFLDIDPARRNANINGVAVLGGDDYLTDRDIAEIELANGIGSVRTLEARRAVFERFRGRGFRFATVVHPRAVVASSASLGEGAQIMAGAIIQPNAVIGENTIVNTGAIIDHDCRVGAHCHVAPGCTLSGNVTIGSGSHIGTGSSVRQAVRLGAHTLVGAGAVVVNDYPDAAILLGVPARAKP